MKNQIPAEIFKAYDIRGVVGKTLTLELMQAIGKVLGTLALEQNVTALVVGRDGRNSSEPLSKMLIEGILKAGCNVYDIGEVATPQVYFANYELKTYSGVMITGSHNPPEYNGLKMVIKEKTLVSEDIQEIYQRLVNKNYNDNQVAQYNFHDIDNLYMQKITSQIKLKRKISIIVDCGNGVAAKIAPKLYRRLGAKVLGMFCEVDGNFPNHHPDPSQPKNLQDLTQALSLEHIDAEIGLAFDGDGDRLGLVTRDGNIIYPDRQMMLFAADILEANPKAKVVYDVKCSSLLPQWVSEHGGLPIICRTGHSFIKAKIKEEGALLAGEMSGHLFFKDKWYGVDDAIYAGARLLEILSRVEDPSLLLNSLPNSIATPELNIKVKEGEQHSIMKNLALSAKFSKEATVITVDGLRAEYSDGFGLVRASNTTPVLVLRFEGQTKEALERIKAEFKDNLSPYVAKSELQF